MKMLTKQQAKDVLGVGTTVFSEYCNRTSTPSPSPTTPYTPRSCACPSATCGTG